MMKNNKKKRIVALIFGGLLTIVIIPLIFYILSKPLDIYFNLEILIPVPYNWIIGTPIFIFGFFWSLISNIQLFTEGKGGPIPRSGIQTQKLVIKGVYKYSRNPMLFGYILALIGLGFILNSLFFIILPNISIFPLLLIYIKLKEEKGLEQRFGDDYIRYKQATSFIIPWFPKHMEKIEKNSS